ncbi:LysR family transcriptional regulator [Escherichia coli]|nr:LysR family transcriptional regulator [Escherichia coli]
MLEAADKLTTDAEALARGWETHLTIVTEALVPTPAFFPLIDKLAAKANTQLAIITEVLAGAWERLEQGRADIVIAPDMHFSFLVGDQLAQALYVNERLRCRA